MDINEALARIAQLEADKATNDAKITQLERNATEQNSYIGKLEAERTKQKVTIQPAPNQVQAAPSAGDDPVIRKYLQKNMRRDVIAETLQELSKTIDSKIIDCLKPDLEKFLNDNMTISNTTNGYVSQAFYLIYGKAAADPNHPIKKLLSTTPENKPNTSPAPTTTRNALGLANAMAAAVPPQMTPSDTNAASGPSVTKPAIASTSEAIKAWKNNILAGMNPFSGNK